MCFKNVLIIIESVPETAVKYNKLLYAQLAIIHLKNNNKASSTSRKDSSTKY